MTLFTVRAQAYTGTTFRLRVDDLDLTTGIDNERTVTDLNMTSTASGDSNTPLGTLTWFGQISTTSWVSITATSALGADLGGVLTLTGTVKNQTTSNHQITISLEDSGYTPPAATVNFVSSFTSGTLPSTATSIRLSSWLDTLNHDPAFGTDTSLVAKSSTPVVIPADGSNLIADNQQYTQATFPTAFPTNAGGSADLSSIYGVPNASYSVFSQVAVTFNGNGGQADFSLTAGDIPTNSVPEPTSLLLLGSALLGVGVFRRKK